MDIRKIFAGVVSGTVVFLMFRALLWGLDQRAHGKDYWLIFAHVIPFMAVVLLAALLILLGSNWLIRRTERRRGEDAS